MYKGGLTKDHPHAYGDKGSVYQKTAWYRGSSPRVWGQAKQEELRKAQARIIPTRVGTSLTWLSSDDVAEDHPHACGDKFMNVMEFFGDMGSSPRVWGQAICW